MTLDANPFEACLRDISQAQARLQRLTTLRITGAEERDFLKSLAYKWFELYRAQVAGKAPDKPLTTLDSIMDAVLAATDRETPKSLYVSALKEAAHAIAALRSGSLIAQPTTALAPTPDFSALASDPAMNGILQRRWVECQRCRMADAHLASTVMMGGLLEALFVARANQMSDKSKLFRANSAPKNRRTNVVLPLAEWTLSPYIDVGAELGWITRSGREVAVVLRDYRNHVHPEKERSQGVVLGPADTEMFWEVTKSLTRQLLDSTRNP